MAASQCIEASRRGDDLLKKGDLSDFETGMVVGARRAGLSISETADLPGFSCTTISGFAGNGPKKRKYPVSGSCVDKNAILMSGVRGDEQTGSR